MAGPLPGDAYRTIGVVTAKAAPLLLPEIFTFADPDIVPVGTTAVIEVSLQVVTCALTAPEVVGKVTVPVPWLVPKFIPVMLTVAPMGPEIGAMPVTFGGEGGGYAE